MIEETCAQASLHRLSRDGGGHRGTSGLAKSLERMGVCFFSGPRTLQFVADSNQNPKKMSSHPFPLKIMCLCNDAIAPSRWHQRAIGAVPSSSAFLSPRQGFTKAKFRDFLGMARVSRLSWDGTSHQHNDTRSLFGRRCLGSTHDAAKRKVSHFAPTRASRTAPSCPLELVLLHVRNPLPGLGKLDLDRPVRRRQAIRRQYNLLDGPGSAR